MLLEIILIKKTGQGFEDVFNSIAKHRWGEDFESWKAQGPIGDFKCDGYHVPEKAVYQCYGPETADPSRTASKIRKDFEGAKNHFGARMGKWVFVYNQDALPATSGKLLGDLRELNPDVDIRCWCINDLLNLGMELPIDRLSRICGTGLQGHRFQEATVQALERYISEHREPVLPAVEKPPVLYNQPTLDQALDNIEARDREIRRRILGYAMWLEPLPKAELENRIAEQQIDVVAIEPNLERLRQMELIRVTTSHILPIDKRICSEAAETVTDEFIAELEDL